MPIYEYECTECGAHFEKLQRFGDPVPDTCPNGHHQVHRLLSQPTIIFKGKGFYVTDHGRNGRSMPSKKKEPQDKEPATASTKTETKPAGGDEPGSTASPIGPEKPSA
jgi:putative FmdB family regulatory protein